MPLERQALLRSALFMAVLLSFAQPALCDEVVTVRLDFGENALTGICQNILSGEDGMPLRTFNPDAVYHHGRFIDPVPLGAIVTKIEVTLWAGRWADPPDAIGVFFSQESHLPTSTPIGEPVPFASPALDCHNPPAQLLPTFHFTSETYPAGFPFYVYRNIQPNTPNLINILRIGGGNFGVGLEGGKVTLHYEPPPRIEFVTTSDEETQRHILLHKYRADASYPSRHQEADGTIVVYARVLKSTGEPLPDQRVYFRLADPPDTAAYFQGRSTWGDNYTPQFEPQAKLSVTEVTSDNAGIVSTTLSVPDHIAGNNYAIEAGFTNDLLGTRYTCEQLNCFRSYEFTTWKRIYLEHDAMFRKGSLLWADSGANAPPQLANDPDHTRSLYVVDRGEFHKGDTVMAVHAPRADMIGRLEFYSETRKVVRVERLSGKNKDQGRIVLDRPLAGDYYAEDFSDPLLGDGVGIVGSASAPLGDWTLLANTLFLTPFAEAFIEYIHMPANWTEKPPGAQTAADPGTLVPHVTVINKNPGGPVRAQRFARKWFKSFGLPNHQHLLGVDTPANGLDRGITFAGAGENVTYIYSGFIDGRRSSYRDWGLNGEVTFHELSHQWHVDEYDTGPPLSEHCLEFMWPTSSLSCSMIPDMGREVTAPGADSECSSTICNEWFDGKVGFHVVFDGLGHVRSEFLDIRRRPEPVPQSYGVQSK
jgi:hypothetical protein